MNNLATRYYNSAREDYSSGEYKSAKGYYERYYNLLCGWKGGNNSDTFNALNGMANSCYCLSEYEKACELYEKCYAIGKYIYDDDNERLKEVRSFWIYSLSYATDAIRDLGEYPEAEHRYEKCYEMACAHIGEEDSFTLGVLNNIAYCSYMMENYVKAKRFFKKCYEISLRVLGENHSDTKTALENYKLAESQVELSSQAHQQSRDFEWNDGSYYIGDMVNGKPHGLGTRYYRDGRKIYGTWEKGHITYVAPIE